MNSLTRSWLTKYGSPLRRLQQVLINPAHNLWFILLSGFYFSQHCALPPFTSLLCCPYSLHYSVLSIPAIQYLRFILSRVRLIKVLPFLTLCTYDLHPTISSFYREPILWFRKNMCMLLPGSELKALWKKANGSCFFCYLHTIWVCWDLWEFSDKGVNWNNNPEGFF